MSENQLIEQHNRNQELFSSERSIWASFAQVNGSAGCGNSIRKNERSSGVCNINGQFCIPAGATPVPGRYGTITDYQCWTCNKWVHTNRNNNFPKSIENVSNLCVNLVNLNTTIYDFYLKDSVYLLDSAATHSRLTNLKTYKNKYSLCTLTNVGSIEFNCRGNLDFLPISPRYNPDSVANILALNEVNNIDGSYVWCMGNKEDAFYVIFKIICMMNFKRCDSGLYYYDTEIK